MILILFVVCTTGNCEFCPFSYLFFRVSNLLLWVPLTAYNNNLSNTPSFISLYMSQVRGSCAHIKGKYDSHSPCLNCSGCSRFNCCVVCHSCADAIWDLADKCRSFRVRQMGKKKESREKQQKGFHSKRSSKTDSQDDPAGSSMVSLDDDSPSGEPAPALSLSSSGGDQRLGNSSVPSQRSHGTTGSKADTGTRATHRSTPTRSHPGDLDGKYGVQASAIDFEATPLGPNPPPGYNPTLSTLSQDRSSRSGSKCPVDRPSSRDRSDRSATKGSTGNQSHRVLVTPVTGHTGCTGQTRHTGHIGQTGCTGHTGSTGSTGHTGQHRSESSRSSGYSAPGPV